MTNLVSFFKRLLFILTGAVLAALACFFAFPLLSAVLWVRGLFTVLQYVQQVSSKTTPWERRQGESIAFYPRYSCVQRGKKREFVVAVWVVPDLKSTILSFFVLLMHCTRSLTSRRPRNEVTTACNLMLWADLSLPAVDLGEDEEWSIARAHAITRNRW